MKTFFSILSASLLLVSCSHQPTTPVVYTSEDWMSGDDRVEYVQRSERVPSTAKITKYNITGTCGGYPKVDVKTAPGFCLGLVYDGVGTLKKARWSAVLNEKTLIVTDMGGWSAFAGKIYFLKLGGGKGTLTPLLTTTNFSSTDPRRGILDRPNQISRGPDGKFYVGSVPGLFRFDPLAADPADSVEVLISKVPGVGLHPLRSFAFDNKGGIYLNVGSASNVCQNFTKFGSSDPKVNPKNFNRAQFKSCPEVEDLNIGQAQIRKYQFMADGRVSSDFVVFAKGLRNSISLIWDERRQVVLQGENGRDAISKADPKFVNADFPHEELNILREGQHYGWPYCFDNNRNNPEWFNIDCSRFTAPHLLLPPHAAPLGFAIYEGNLFPSWYKGRLLAAFHGYEAKGHRLVTFKRDEKGLPTGNALSLVYGWDKKGEQDMGKPVGLTEMPDGSLIIVEDDPQNKITRLFYDGTQGNGQPVSEVSQQQPTKPTAPLDEDGLKKRLEQKLAQANPPPFAAFQSKVIDKTCAECHQVDGAPGVQLIKYDDEGNAQRLVAAGKAQELLEIIRGNPNFIPMPPQGWDTPEEQKEAVLLLEQWIASLKK